MCARAGVDSRPSRAKDVIVGSIFADRMLRRMMKIEGTFSLLVVKDSVVLMMLLKESGFSPAVI